MRWFLLACGAVLVFAIAFEILASGQSPDALLRLLFALPLAQKAAWLVIAAAALALLVAAVWQGEQLIQQRRAADVLETRLRGARREVEELDQAQDNIDAASRHLDRSDPEQSIVVLARRLAEAEWTAQAQQSRNDPADLQTRIDETRRQQQAVREKLGVLIEKRRSIEPLVVDLQKNQDELDRALRAIEADSLQDRVRALADAAMRMAHRCADIEESVKTVGLLRGDIGALQSRLAPLEDDHSGVESTIAAAHAARDQLAASIARLDHGSEMALGDRVQAARRRPAGP